MTDRGLEEWIEECTHEMPKTVVGFGDDGTRWKYE